MYRVLSSNFLDYQPICDANYLQSHIHTHRQTHMCVLLIGLSVLTAPVSDYVAKT